jgi:hypothetical protein
MLNNNASPPRHSLNQREDNTSDNPPYAGQRARARRAMIASTDATPQTKHNWFEGSWSDGFLIVG